MTEKLSNPEWIKNVSIDDIPSEHIRAIANCCGIQGAISLMIHLRGIEIYIPKSCKKTMDLQYIKRTFSGRNVSAIAVHLKKNRNEIDRMIKKTKTIPLTFRAFEIVFLSI